MAGRALRSRTRLEPIVTLALTDRIQAVSDGDADDADKYVKTPMFVMNAYFDRRISLPALGLYQTLRTFRNNANGAAWPSLARLAQLMDYKKPDRLSRYIKELEQIGAIEVHRMKGANNIYVLPDARPKPSSLWKTAPEEVSTAPSSGGTPPHPEGDTPPPPAGDELDRFNPDPRTSPRRGRRAPQQRLPKPPLPDRPKMLDFHAVLPLLEQGLGRILDLAEEMRVRAMLRHRLSPNEIVLALGGA